MEKIKCSICGYDRYKGGLHIHHKDGNHENDAESNLEVLCANCHFEIHKEKFKEKITKSKCHKLKEDFQELISMHNIAITQYRKDHEDLQRQMTAHVSMR